MISSRTRTWCAAAAALAAVALAAPVGAAVAVWNVAHVGGPASADGVLVAVVDTGVDPTHPAFGDRVVAQRDFVGDGAAGDPDGHGTHVAGTLAGGAIDCGGGAAGIGVAASARILSVRVLDGDGRGYLSDVVDGIRHAADQGAAVINLSLGERIRIVGNDPDFEHALRYAWDRGSIPVLAAGNGYLLGAMTGSGYADVPAVVVTATTRDDRKASYATSVGDVRWGIAAPGGEGGGGTEGAVLSAAPGSRCATSAGTSMAAPHVSGALAVLRARGLSPQQAVDRLLATARPVGPRSTFGAGVVDLAAALDGLDGASPPTPAPTSAPAPDEVVPRVERSGSVPASSPAPATTATPHAATTAPTDSASSGTAASPAAPGATEGTTTTVASTTTSTGVPDATDVAGGATIVDPGEGDATRTAAAVVAGAAALAVGALTGRAALRRR